jgi:replicative DNA helicase
MHPHLHAEQALLGALLLEPTRVEDVRERLRPKHMYRPAHAALYRVLLDQPTPPDAAITTATRVMTLVHAATAHTAGITPAYAHTLMAACPHPRNALTYARMIVDAADHRTVTAHAIRLEQVAAADRDRDGLHDTLTHHRALHRALDDLAHRWGEPRRTPMPDFVVQAAPPSKPCPRDVADERALVAALITDPHPFDEIARWLLATDFVDRTHAALYQCVTALVHRGEAVDPLTVLWEAQRRRHLTDGTLDPELVLHIGTSGVPGSTDYWARRVLRASLLRTATATATAVRTLAEDRALPARGLVATAREALAPLDAIRNRWHTAIRSPAREARSETSGESAASTASAVRSRTGTVSPPPWSGPSATTPTTAHGPTHGRRP